MVSAPIVATKYAFFKDFDDPQDPPTGNLKLSPIYEPLQNSATVPEQKCRLLLVRFAASVICFGYILTLEQS